MQSGDKKTVAGVAVGLAAGAVYMTGPLAFPSISQEYWQIFFWLMVAVLTISIVYFILVHAIREERAMPLSLMIVGGILFFAGSIWLGISNQKSERNEGAVATGGLTLPLPAHGPEVSLRFFSPMAPLLEIVNNSDVTARQIKFSVILWNLGKPTEKNPLPIPVRTFDFVRPHLKSGAQSVVDRISGLDNGARLFGSISVECPDCVRGRTYWIYIVWGVGGWYAEIIDLTSGGIMVPFNMKDIVVEPPIT